jgi:hypothetical protein
MSLLDELPERETLPQFCPQCGDAIKQKWNNDVTDLSKTRVEGHKCIRCSWRCKIERPAVEVEE